MNLEKLIEKRISKKITHEELAKELGISRPCYTIKENGRAEFTRKDIGVIRRKLKLSPKEIVDIFLD